jgi:two-component system cell cycle response regulator
MKDTKEDDKHEILIVEDSPTQAEELKYILETQGFHARITKNGMEALHYLENHIPSIIVSDIIMPEMDGYRLCKKIKSDERMRHIPVMLLTTLSEPEDVIKGLDCGSDGFMIKPYDEEALISRINYILLNAEVRKNTTTEMGIEIVFAGKKHFITSTRIQILDLLISIYQNAIQKARELERTVKELKSANETIKTLKGFIPICSMCKKVRDDQGYWQQIELYIRDHSEADFTHSYCPECKQKILHPEHYKKT